MRPSTHSWRGLTFIEMIIVIAVASIIIIALTAFVGRSFNVSREQFEQIRITEDARKEMERVSEAIRDVRFVDLDNPADSYTDKPDEQHIQIADAFDLQFYANVDGDDDVELVRYFVEPSNDEQHLKRGIKEPIDTGTEISYSGDETATTLIRSIRNTPEQPLFTYYRSNSTDVLTGRMTPTTKPADIAAIGRVGIHLVIDVNTNRYPPAADIVTEATPRSIECAEDDCGPKACFPFVPIALTPRDSTTPFVEPAFQECEAYCANVARPVGECCAWHVSFPDNDNAPGMVVPYCECRKVAPPNRLPDEDTINPDIDTDGLSDFYKAAWAPQGTSSPLCVPQDGNCFSGPYNCWN